VPHRQNHRGAHPDDAQLFSPVERARLLPASEEIVWLLGRGYPIESTLALVGGHHQLTARQRLALGRSLSSEATRDARAARAVARDAVAGRVLSIDGFNLIITVEVALSGGLVLDGFDGTVRDLAGLRGSYHTVEETDQALIEIGVQLERLRPAATAWLLDAPVSNSGRLRARILDAARAWPCPTTVELVANPDPILATRADVVTADGAILDRAQSWVNLARWVVDDQIASAWRLRLF
jgi:hypothetical protein